MALKGLTANDRANWEKTYQAQLQGRSKQEIDNAWINWNVKRRYGNDVYNKLGDASQREAYWNSHQDEYIRDSLKTITTKVKENEEAGKYKRPIQSIKMDNDATLVNSPDLRVAKANTPAAMKEFKEQSDAYHKARLHYDEEYSRAYKLGQEAKRDVQDIAEQVSPYYKKYKGTEYLPLNDDDWLEIAKEYNSLRDSRGENVALIYLQRKMQDTVSKNQSIPEKLWNGFLGMGATAYATILDATAGIAKGTYDFWSGEHKDIPGINTPGIKQVANYLDAIIDNDITRYTSDVVKYGSIFNSEIEQAKEIGIGNHPIIQTYAQETGSADLMETLFNANTLPNLMSQVGFTAGMATTGKALGALSRWGFRAYKGTKLAQKMAETGKTAMQVRDALGRIQKAENIVNRYGIPAAVGTMEGLFNGLETKQQFMEDGQREIAEFQQKYVDEEFNRLIAEKYNDRVQQLTNEYLNKQSFTKGKDGAFRKQMPDPNAIQRQILDELYEEAWANYEDKYKDVEDQLEHNASIAGMTNFLINSGINGIMNQTLKATLFNPTTTGAIRQSRLGKIFKPRGRYKVSGTGANTTVEGKYGLWDQFKAMTKEPAGELMEEYEQNISDEFSRGGANNNLQHFLRNKYEGDGSAHVGELWLDDAAAAFKSAGIAAVSKEGIRDGFYGALGSVMGMPTLSQRTTAVDAKGNIIKDANGRAKKTLFGRGLNSAGEVESNLERIARIMPWRSGVLQAWNENKAMKKDVEETTKALQDWIRKPENRAKYDGSVGTFNWAEELQQSADANDVFGYKNSALGKAVNDAIMLDKLKGTEFYNSYMDQVFKMANLEADSEEAKQVIDIMRDNIATKEAVEGMSDNEILDKIKKNANSVLDRQTQIAQISRRLEKQFGELDDDTKESLIYGELQIADWEGRHNNLNEEISSLYADAKVKDSVEKSSLSEEQKALIGKYGSIEKAIATRDKYRSNIKELQESIAKIEEWKNSGKLTDVQKDILQRQKNTLEFLKGQEKEFAALKDITEDTNTVLSEAEIMDLDPIARAIMLNPKNLSNYSEKQQQVINKIIAAAEKPGSDFLTKVLDDGKISESVSRFLREYKAVVADPDSFSMYSRLAKSEAAKRAYGERYDSLRDIKDYTEFAHAMDQLYTNASFTERNTILRQFDEDEAQAQGINAETNYSRYRAERQQIAEVLKNASKSKEFANMSSNDINMFVHAITYLTEKGVNLNDQEAITNTLSQSDAKGNMFEQYVNALNGNADDLVKTDFTSVGEVIQTIKDVLGKYHVDEAKSTAINNPVAGSDTPSESNNPVIPPTPTPTPTPTQPTTPSRPGIFGTSSAFSSVEESAEALNREQTPIGEQSTEQRTPLSSYAKNSIGEVVQQAEVMYNMFSTEKEQTTKDKAIEVLNGLKDNSFTTLEGFLSTVEARANELDASGEGSQEAAALLRNAVVRIRANAENQRLSEERRQQLNQKESIERSPLLGRVMGINPATSNTNSSNVTTVNLQWLRQVATATPEDQNYSPLLSYLERNHVEQFLQSDRIDRSTPVYFISDPQLAAEQAEIYRQRNLNYGAERLPLIPVVESKEGPITIGDKRYQPIGIMSATNARNISGSSRLGIIREKINPNATSPELILGEDGQPIVTRLSANVHAEPIGQSSSNNTIQEAGQEGLTAEERTELNRLTKEDRRKSPIYQKMKERFLKRLRFNPNKVSKRSGKTYGGLEFDIPTMKNGTSFPADVWVREVHRTTAANSDATIADLLNRNDPSALNANSRVRGYMRELDKALGAFDDESISFEGDNPTEGALGAVKALAETLNNKLSNFIRTRGYSYVVTPTQRETANRKAILELGMTDGTTVVPLGEIHAGTLSESEKLQVLKNLIMEGDHVRMQDSFHAVAQWNVNYNNVEVASEDISTASEERQKVIKAAQLDVSNVYDDDILETSKPTLSYRITTVSLEAPYTLEGERKTFATVANSDNASPATPMNDTPMADSQVVTSNGSVVDGDTGTTIQGAANIAKSEIDKISERLAETIQQDAANFHLSEDEAHYEDGSGKKYARVTSVISADAEGERFDSESPWVLPSTNIGTGVDEFVRDFFAGRFTKDDNGQWGVDGHPIGDVYPNATQKSLTNFIAQLEAFKNKLQADGIVILPREVMAHGTLQITDNKGKAHTIDVAGTLDLLGYDKEGNWHIYDMKTVRNPNVDDHKKAKWSRQLSLYKKFLEDTYGIKVKDLTVIPIKVDYPAPSQRTKYTVSEDKHESYNGRAGNQLIINGVQKFEGARPTLMPTIPIEEKPLDIKYEKLSEAEKEVMSEVREVTSQMLQDKAETVDQGSSEVNTTTSTTTDSIQVDSSDATSVIDPTTAMPDTEDISGLFSRKRKKKGKPRNTDASHPLNQYVSSSQAWGVFEGQGLNVEETLKNLEQAGITEEKWNQMSEEERQHELDCKGVK